MKTGPWPKQQGQVKWFNSRKRYGFIAAEEGEEIFSTNDRLSQTTTATYTKDNQRGFTYTALQRGQRQ
jgi:cold shock CspA family protein